MVFVCGAGAGPFCVRRALVKILRRPESILRRRNPSASRNQAAIACSRIHVRWYTRHSCCQALFILHLTAFCLLTPGSCSFLLRGEAADHRNGGRRCEAPEGRQNLAHGASHGIPARPEKSPPSPLERGCPRNDGGRVAQLVTPCAMCADNAAALPACHPGHVCPQFAERPRA